MKRSLLLRMAVLASALILCGCRSGKRSGGLTLEAPAGLGPMIASVRSVLGTPEIGGTNLEHRWTEVGVGYAVASGSAILTGFHEEITLVLPQGSVLTIVPGSWIETGVSPEGTPIFRTVRGKISGTIEGGPIEFHNLSGGSILLTPNPGARVPISMDDQPNEELHRLLGLGAPNWAYGDWAVNSPPVFLPFVARAAVGIPLNQGGQIPEPGSVRLAVAGSALLVGFLAWRRQPSRR